MPPWCISNCSTRPQTRNATAVATDHARIETIKVRLRADRWSRTVIWLSSTDLVGLRCRPGTKVATGASAFVANRLGVDRLAADQLGAHGFSGRRDVIVGHLSLEVLGLIFE